MVYAFAKQQAFDRLALFYDCWLPSVFYQATHKRLLECAELPENANVLDIGCGTGRLLNRKHQHLLGVNLLTIFVKPHLSS
ncbi:MAG: hypothetical protein ACFB14_12525 [Leptolyngbyaceae cyanobacterium]